MILTALERLCSLLRGIITILMIALTIPVGMQVISRYISFIPPVLWTEELATFIFIWIVMIGSMIAVWEGTHFDVAVTPDAKRPLGKLLQNGIVSLFVLLFAAYFAWYGIEFAKVGSIQSSVMLRANLLWTYITVPLAGSIWLLFAGYRTFELIQKFRRGEGAAS